MTAKQEAAAMVLSFLGIVGNNMKYAKECALVAIGKILPIVESYEDALSASQRGDDYKHWQEVKQEIEAL